MELLVELPATKLASEVMQKQFLKTGNRCNSGEYFRRLAQSATDWPTKKALESGVMACWNRKQDANLAIVELVGLLVEQTAWLSDATQLELILKGVNIT